MYKILAILSLVQINAYIVSYDYGENSVDDEGDIIYDDQGDIISYIKSSEDEIISDYNYEANKTFEQTVFINYTKLKEENYNLKLTIMNLYTLLNDLQYYFLLLFILTILCKVHSCKRKQVKHVRIVERDSSTDQESLKI